VKLLIVMLMLAVQMGCTATCVRDSDCIGNSICENDRCLLVVRRGDAGSAMSPGGSSGTASNTGGDAGSTQGQGGVGGDTTDPRLNVDAAADSDPPTSSQ